ncbi:DUF1987 domain-containing protein [candidate division CSSED10-310 bacterium]|uniref:DUF1987 domain-containing protein n=1 Tax=candidate division CSSED10-310 bacterium TaxID=2855610 RepID=A0ABV6YUG4_UNCC1
MEHISREATGDEPAVDFNPETGQLQLTGESYPEYPGIFYTPLIKWAEQFITTKPEKIELFIHLRYFNTSSSKCLIDLLEILEEYAETGGHVTVFWHYDQGDVDALEAGKDLDEDIQLHFVFEEVK